VISVIGASSTTPVIITISQPLAFGTKEIKITGVKGNEAANGAFYIGASETATRYSLYSDAALDMPVAPNGVYESGGTVMLTSDDDHAIVVGISKYPALTALHGPENDARRFYDWVVSPTGGNVAMRNAKRILSSQYVIDENDLETWKPALDALKAAFWRYAKSALTKARENDGDTHVGRRLWIFLAGHGITPTKSPDADFDTAALLAASADIGRYGEHLSAYSWLKWFREAAAFDELLLFMDCCRDVKPNVAPLPCTLEVLRGDSERRAKVKHLYAAATDLDSKSWEIKIGEQYHGVFSLALLDALESDNLLDEEGRLTADALAKYLAAEVPRRRPLQTPRFIPDTPPDITIVQRHPTFNTEITFDPRLYGQEVTLFGNDIRMPIDNSIAGEDPWSLQLTPFRIYKLCAGSTKQFIEHSGDLTRVHVS
jgi:hypothetical protein